MSVSQRQKIQKKTNCVPGHWFIGGRVVSIVFHPFDGVLSIVEGPFFGVLAIIVVCCIEIVVCVVDDFEHQEKTHPRQGLSFVYTCDTTEE